jgi:hypothetical protein
MKSVINFELLIVLIPVLGVLLRYALPLLVQKIGKGNIDNAAYWVGIAVMAAEQIYKDRYQGAIKKDYVLKFLKDKGIKLTEAELNVLIEAAVKELNSAGKLIFNK